MNTACQLLSPAQMYRLLFLMSSVTSAPGGYIFNTQSKISDPQSQHHLGAR